MGDPGIGGAVVIGAAGGGRILSRERADRATLRRRGSLGHHHDRLDQRVRPGEQRLRHLVSDPSRFESVDGDDERLPPSGGGLREWYGRTGADPKNAYFLRHLASWGFIVIRSRDGSTGQGDTVIDATNHLLDLSRNPSSVFYGKVDAGKIGLAGHSQGAATAARLFSRNSLLFKTYVPIATPLRAVCVVADCTIDLGALPKVTSGSIFYVGGDLDVVSSLPTNVGYYLPTANGVDKVMGMIALGGHTEIEGSPDCASGGVPASCNLGVYPLLGYPTAWFMWKLQGVEDGPAAFAEDGELATNAPGWLGVLSNVRRRP